ncbi:TPA: autotransporter outer membrane beta-barrel domain-containing protein, partial [Campylobacter jejuni]|nr:autotransporter outer membrane beta-barrel domain-containing protein [Campylobacter jejuni]
QAGSNGVNIASGTSIENFSNSGYIEGESISGAVNVLSNIGTFTNKGTIKNKGTRQPSMYVEVSSGVYLDSNTIQTFTNEGLISGIMGLNLVQATINNFNNKGTIESTSSSNIGAAINLMTVWNDASTIENLTNSGTIKSNSNGIQAEAGNEIKTLTNQGVIEANLNGISFYDNGASGEK